MSRDAPALEGRVNAKGLRIGVIVSRFNAEITEALLQGALEALSQHGADARRIDVLRVPGAFEIGAVAVRMADSGYQAIVCLGCVIRGESTHYDYVCQGVTTAVGAVANRGDVGVGFGVLTVETEAQAWDRAGGVHGNKGAEAALTAVEMARLLESLGA
ncbi:MAG: 6,7-dimethyl-8-ribityllumazine synthase [Mariprofundaceae bacterium]